MIRKIGIAISDPTRSLAASKLVSYVSSQPVQPAGVGMLGKHRQRPLPLLVIPGLLPDPRVDVGALRAGSPRAGSAAGLTIGLAPTLWG